MSFPGERLPARPDQPAERGPLRFDRGNPDLLGEGEACRDEGGAIWYRYGEQLVRLFPPAPIVAQPAAVASEWPVEGFWYGDLEVTEAALYYLVKANSQITGFDILLHEGPTIAAVVDLYVGELLAATVAIAAGDLDATVDTASPFPAVAGTLLRVAIPSVTGGSGMLISIRGTTGGA